MTIFVEDTFTDTNGTDLDAHTGETGATWTEGAGHGTGNFAIINNRAYAEAGVNQEHNYYASGVPGSADYTVTAVFRRISDGGVHTTNVRARSVIAAETFYYVGTTEYATPNQWILGKVVAGSETELDTFVGDNATSTDYTMVWELSGTGHTVTINSTERLTATDSAIADAGRLGIGGFHNSGDNGGWQVDSLSADDGLGGNVDVTGVAGVATASGPTPGVTSVTRPYINIAVA